MAAGGPSILVVDDEEDTCTNLQDILTELGYAVDVAYDGFAALDLVDKHSYDVALVDLKMPGMDGLQLFHQIKQRGTGTVAIIVTACADSDVTIKARQVGIAHVLPKPVDFSQLMKLVNEALERPLVLVVDDDRDLCASVADVLIDKGYRVCVAHDGDEALQQLRRQSHRIVLLDMKLPPEGGAELFHSVRRLQPDARVVVITSWRSEMECQIEQMLQQGAHGVCYKPFDMDHLLTMLRQLVAKRDAAR